MQRGPKPCKKPIKRSSAGHDPHWDNCPVSLSLYSPLVLSPVPSPSSPSLLLPLPPLHLALANPLLSIYFILSLSPVPTPSLFPLALSLLSISPSASLLRRLPLSVSLSVNSVT